MKLVTLASSYPRFPGDYAGVFVRSLVNATRSHGADVTVLAPYESRVDSAWSRAERLHHFRFTPFARWHRMGYGLALDDDRHLRRGAYALAPAYVAAGSTALLRLVRRVSPDAIHCHWVIPNGPIAAAVASLTGTPLVITLHGSDIFVARRMAAAGLLARFAFKTAALVTACSDDLAAGAVALGADPSTVLVSPWGVDSETFSCGDGSSFRRKHGIPTNARVIVAAGRLVAKKGFGVLVEAARSIVARHPDTVIVVAGDGALGGALARQAGAVGLAANVRLVGAVAWHEMPNMLAAADMVVVPSVMDTDGNVDGLPTVLLEAMGAGKPVVASRIAGIPLVIADSLTGVLVPPGDASALAAACCSLLSHPGRARWLGQNAQARARADLSWRAIARRYLDSFAAAGIGS